MLTFAQALGSMPMKLCARVILRTSGFRTTLVVDTFLTAAAMVLCALLTQGTPAVAILVLIFFTGFFRSLQFTSLQTLGYADIPSDRMSSSTSLAVMLQQLANGVGVAFAALLLQASTAWRGAAEVAVEDFRFTFLVMAGFAMTAALLYLRLAPDAGNEVSGHRPRAARAATPTQPSSGD
jgi:predicted MFS family arabinose efflux permease